MSDDLVEWLRAQLDLDQQNAREAQQEAEVWQAAWTGQYAPAGWIRAVNEEDAWMVGEVSTLAQARHIALHDPSRVLREVEAKRKILDAHVVDGNWCPMGDQIFKVLALPYSDRPGYRETWRPA